MTKISLKYTGGENIGSVPSESRFILFHLPFLRLGGVWEDIGLKKMLQNFLE